MSKGEKIANHVLLRISDYLKRGVSNLYLEIRDSPILQTLKEETEHKIFRVHIMNCRYACPISEVERAMRSPLENNSRIKKLMFEDIVFLPRGFRIYPPLPRREWKRRQAHRA